jgi:hypothetical protein
MNEILLPAPSGLTLYVIVTNSLGRAYRTDTAVFETLTEANREDYAIALTAANIVTLYQGTFPVVAAGVYGVQPYQQVGASPASDDVQWPGGLMQWDGTAEVGLSGINATLSEGNVADIAAGVSEAVGAGAAAPEQCRVYGYLFSGGGAAKARVKVVATLLNPPQATDTAVLETVSLITYSGSGGYWYLDLVRELDYRIVITDAGIDQTITPPDAASADLRTLL